jgi:hypothetical protein
MLANTHQQVDSELARVIDAWSSLPEAVKVGIMAMVKASTPGQEG